MKKSNRMVLLLSLISGYASFDRAIAQTEVAPKPKYGPEITLLSSSHEHIQTKAALDYWAISPYYLPQRTNHSCTTAASAMVINAARKDHLLTADDEIATEAGILERVKDANWETNVSESEEAHGLSLDEMKEALSRALIAYDVKKFSIKVVHTQDQSAATQAKLHADLLSNEGSAKNFIIANFIQGIYTGDAMAGHMAPVGAYDAVNGRVLIMDPDRQWYEPYWVSEKPSLQGWQHKIKPMVCFVDI